MDAGGLVEGDRRPEKAAWRATSIASRADGLQEVVALPENRAHSSPPPELPAPGAGGGCLQHCRSSALLSATGISGKNWMVTVTENCHGNELFRDDLTDLWTGATPVQTADNATCSRRHLPPCPAC